jgi:hypothetical protein
MSRMDLSENRFLTDYRVVSFIVESNDQQYELAINQIYISSEITMFYTIFKPNEYDHIIFMSSFTQSWVKAKQIFKDVVAQIEQSYGIVVEDYPDLALFIS